MIHIKHLLLTDGLHVHILDYLFFIENVSGAEDKKQQEKPKVKRRKRKATSPIEGPKSSDESANSSTESLHIKSKVAKASSREKSNINVDDFFEEARYFVMKSNNHENVALSKAKVSTLFLL